MTENFKEIKLARRSDSLQKLYPTVYKYTTKKRERLIILVVIMNSQKYQTQT